MNFATAVRTCFHKYATFSGTATRGEYWWFVLFNFVGSAVFALTGLGLLRYLWALALLVPGLAVAVRRHHDAGRSGWWLLASIIPPWEIVLLCYPSKRVGNRYADGSPSTSRAPLSEADVTASTFRCPRCDKLRLPGQNYCAGCGEKFTVD